MQRIIWGAVAIMASAGLVGPADARKKPREAWSVSRSSDPITGDSSCVVTASDQAAGMKFTRVGYLYPIVESSSKLGLLVGVSSGGRFRLPTGDILWRVDDHGHRELKATDNPATGSAPIIVPYKTGNDAADKAMAAAMAQTSGLAASITATSTVARGDKAKELLVEMLTGRSLVFRQANAVPAYGLPTSRIAEVGQITKDGLRPIPLDDSFRRGLVACGLIPPDA